MTEEHLASVLAAAKAKKDDQGWHVPSEGRHLTLYVSSSSGGSLNVSGVEAIQPEGTLLRARTAKGVVYVLALEDVFAASVEAPPGGGRKAGFV
jgi:hypothetical protein